MYIEGLTTTKVVVEKKTMSSIDSNNVLNKDGTLNIDELNNILVSDVDGGDTELYRLTKYTGGGKLLIYNKSLNMTQLVSSGEFVDILLDYRLGTRYFLGADIVKLKDKEGHKFKYAFGGVKVFKVFLEGLELKNYRVAEDGIEVLGNDIYKINNLTELVVYTYITNKIENNKLSVSKKDSSSDTSMTYTDGSTYTFSIEYEQYMSIHPKMESIEDYLSESNSFDVHHIGDISLTNTTEKSDYITYGKSRKSEVYNNINHSLSFQSFGVGGAKPLHHILGGDVFRVLLIDEMWGRLTILHDCSLQWGTNRNYTKNGNNIDVTINGGGLIDIIPIEGRAYSSYSYGKLTYDGDKMVYNSRVYN